MFIKENAMGHLKIPPKDFWPMTPPEFWVLYRARIVEIYGDKGPPEVITREDTLDFEAEIRRNVARNLAREKKKNGNNT